MTRVQPKTSVYCTDCERFTNASQADNSGIRCEECGSGRVITGNPCRDERFERVLQ